MVSTESGCRALSFLPLLGSETCGSCSRVAHTDSVFKQPSLIAPGIGFGSRSPSLPSPYGKVRGMERREAPPSFALRRAPLAIGTLASRRSIAAFTGGPPMRLPPSAPGRVSGNRHWRQPVQRAPRRAPFSSARAGSGAARVQVCVTCPQGPHPAPPARTPHDGALG